jgi:hypothetical protein
MTYTLSLFLCMATEPGVLLEKPKSLKYSDNLAAFYGSRSFIT